MIILTLTRGKVAFVDDEDGPKVLAYKWTAIPSCVKGKWYARRAYKGADGRYHTVYLHRSILDAPQGSLVDHINGDGLDNRRANLRLADRCQNQHNKRVRRQNPTGFKGVHPAGRKFIAGITVRGKHHHLGTFATAEEAARAYNAKARELQGEFAYNN